MKNKVFIVWLIFGLIIFAVALTAYIYPKKYHFIFIDPSKNIYSYGDKITISFYEWNFSIFPNVLEYSNGCTFQESTIESEYAFNEIPETRPRMNMCTMAFVTVKTYPFWFQKKQEEILLAPYNQKVSSELTFNRYISVWPGENTIIIDSQPIKIVMEEKDISLLASDCSIYQDEYWKRWCIFFNPSSEAECIQYTRWSWSLWPNPYASPFDDWQSMVKECIKNIKSK